MATRPTVHSPWTTVGELREFFADEHVHMALLVDAGTLLGTIERADLAAHLGDRTPALEVAVLDGRTVQPEDRLADALAAMRSAARRRLAVVTPGSEVLGLLCLKASGRGFCSDADVAARR
jgi:predicted transcriptional regulator